MRAVRELRRITVGLLAAAAAAGVAGCGQGSAPGTPSASGLPLAPGSRVGARARHCDGGAHPFCGLALVLVAPTGRYASSAALMRAETMRLQRSGWTESKGDTIHQVAAQSPGHRQRLTYAQGGEDLLSIEQGRIERSASISRVLSRELFARTPTLSLMLQAGSA
jgi:hypothetical protein